MVTVAPANRSSRSLWSWTRHEELPVQAQARRALRGGRNKPFCVLLHIGLLVSCRRCRILLEGTLAWHALLVSSVAFTYAKGRAPIRQVRSQCRGWRAVHRGSLQRGTAHVVCRQSFFVVGTLDARRHRGSPH